MASNLDNRFTLKHGPDGARVCQTQTAQINATDAGSTTALANYLAGRAVALDSSGNLTQAAAEFIMGTGGETMPLVGILTTSYYELAVAAPDTSSEVFTQHNPDGAELAYVPVTAGGIWETTGIDTGSLASYTLGTVLKVSTAGDALDGALIPASDASDAAGTVYVGVVEKEPFTDEFGNDAIWIRLHLSFNNAIT